MPRTHAAMVATFRSRSSVVLDRSGLTISDLRAWKDSKAHARTMRQTATEACRTAGQRSLRTPPAIQRMSWSPSLS
jgi:hypothetical protein